MIYLKQICQFPEVAAEPVPFYKHPYKLFALNPALVLIQRAILESGRAAATGSNMPDEALNCTVALGAMSLFFNVGVMTVADSAGPSYHRLKWAACAAACVHVGKEIDMAFSTTPEKYYGEDLIARIVIVATFVLSLVLLIAYANKDVPEIKKQNLV